MKKLLLCGAIALSLNSIGQVPDYVPTNGLAGWWPFTGNANDESGNGNNGIVTGALLTTDRFSNSNSAYSFNGFNNYITTTDIDLNNTATISAWVFPLTNSGPGMQSEALVDKNMDQLTNSGYCLLLNNDNTFGIYGQVGWGGDVNNVIPSNQNLTLSQWHHCVLTLDNGIAKIFINGVLFSTQAGVNPTAQNDDLLLFGKSVWNSNYLEGSLDDIGIWTRALSNCEIQELYNAEILSVSNSVTQVGAQLTADYPGVTYQWLDCDNSNAQIVGETNQSYTPTITGNYAVEINSNGCIDTSACVLVDFTGLEELNNPAKQLIKITDLMGRETPYVSNKVLVYIYSDGTVERVFRLNY